MQRRVEETLEKIRPVLQEDGGDVELVSVEEDKGLVKVRLTGACGNCPFALMTFKGVIEQILKKEVPEVKEVQAV
ncbi:MAG TPA: NifU family protein [Moorella mulderi]|nr:NifU family protein [Moorella mulderi]